MIHRVLRHTAILAATGTLATLGIGLTAGAANASTTNIDQWSPANACINAVNHYYCLWFYAGRGTGGYGWGGTATSTYNIPNSSAAVFNLPGSCPEGTGTACGEGAKVYDNAESMSNGTYDCNVTVWSAYNSGGDADWLAPTWGGNLTSTLSNNDKSIDANHCTG